MAPFTCLTVDTLLAGWQKWPCCVSFIIQPGGSAFFMAAAVFKNVFKPQCMNTFEFLWCHISTVLLIEQVTWQWPVTAKERMPVGSQGGTTPLGAVTDKLLRMRPPRPRRIPGDSADTSRGCMEWLPVLGWRKTGRLKSLILRNETHSLEEWVGINQALRSHQPSWGKSC